MATLYEEILARLVANLTNPENKVEGSFTMNNLQAVALELSRMQSQDILPLLDRVFLDTATGADLDRRALDFGEKRIAATAAHGTIKITGAIGTAVPAGLRVATDTQTFVTTAAGVIDGSGAVSIAATAETAGAAGNVAADTVRRFLSEHIGMASVTNPAAFFGGLDLETDAALRQRLLDKVQHPLTGGNANDYVYWAKQVAGISRAKCFPLWNGNGTVKVAVLSTAYNAVSAEVLTAADAYIQSKRPVGATVTVVSAAPLHITLAAQVTLKAGFTAAAAAQLARDKIKAYFDSIAFDGKTATVSYLKISELLFATGALDDIASYTVNGGSASVAIGAEQYPYLAGVTINGTT